MISEKFVDVAGIRTRYFEKGEGHPLVLFHGGAFGSLPGPDSADDWGLNIDGLAQWFHVYAIDKLGQGYTDNPKSDKDYTMEAVVQHAYGFLQALGLRDLSVVGHSRGAYLVGRLALEHAELLQNCIIVDTATLGPGVSRNSVVHANPPEPRDSKSSHRWVYERYSYSDSHITEEWLTSATRIATLPKYQEAVAKMDSLSSTQFLPILAAQKAETLDQIQHGHLKVPTLLVWGYNDPTAPISMGHALFDLVAGSAPRAEMHVLNKAGHYSYREHPGEFNEVVRGFILHG